MKFIKLYIFVVLLSLSNTSVLSQSFEAYQPLSRYLSTLETNYDINFSYADEEVEYIVVSRLKQSSTLDNHLSHLRQTTPFEYDNYSGNTILVIPQSDSSMVCLSIIDEISKKAIKNAILKSGNFTFKSNQNGLIKLPKPSKIRSSILFANGFLSKDVPNTLFQDNIECNQLTLKPFFELLDEVLLSDFLTSGIKKFTSGALEINYKEFGLLPGLVEPDVLQSLQALPGITSRKESVSYLNVRGGTHDQNLFLWDGIKMYHTSHFFGMISAFNPYMTEKVSLIKNGTSSKYGDGVSSLINMRTNDSIAKTHKASLGVNSINVDAVVQTPLFKKSSLEFSFRHSINSLWESPTYNRYFDKVFQNTEVTNFEPEERFQNNEFSFFDTSLNYKYQFSNKDYFKLSFFLSNDEFSLNRFELEDNNLNTRSSDLNQTNLAFGGFYERNWSKHTSTQLQVYTTNYQQSSTNTNQLNQQKLEQLNEVQENSLRLNLQTKLSPSISLEAGYQLNETRVLNLETINDPSFFREAQNSILSNSLYTQIGYVSKNNHLNLKLGGRLNHYSKFNKVIAEPRFNLSYRLLDDLFFELLGERKSQVTSQIIDLQNDFLGVENRRWVLSNLDNRPIIRSQQTSAGFNYVKTNWFINTDLFFKKIEGITSLGQGFQNQFQFLQDHGSYEIRGLDVLVNRNFKVLSGWMSYSLSENKYQFENLEPPKFHNNLDIRHVISMGFNYEKNGLKLSTGFNWHSGAPTTITSQDQPDPLLQIEFETPNAERLQDYFRWDFSSTYTFRLYRKVKALAGISFWNLLGNTNLNNQFYLIDEAAQKVKSYQQKGLNFTPNIMFRLTF